MPNTHEELLEDLRALGSLFKKWEASELVCCAFDETTIRTRIDVAGKELVLWTDFKDEILPSYTPQLILNIFADTVAEALKNPRTMRTFTAHVYDAVLEKVEGNRPVEGRVTDESCEG